ncbi:type IV toxin-antitoxin system AbiEi family antitoxin domain-containing protein [Marinobacter lacisalsi]|uniref:Type IV toxin-antitoxin system AbiEi family antitoxin domain-containing protein n=1 Tax=Marinobacter lacisalsi TaxID=475979 RepID=A0ABV8QH26_9GAMM
MLNKEARERLKQLLPVSMLATKQWLIDQGLNLHFVDNAIRSRTLLPLTSGVYALYEKSVRWPGVVASLQRMSEQPIHVGGLTALDLAGFTHFLSTSSEVRVHIFSESPLPGWINRIPVAAHFERHSTARLWPESVMRNLGFLREYNWQDGLPPVTYSCPEKALLEVLTEVPSAVSFEHADALMQGLSNLSPRKIDALLRACGNIKVKRLFLWLAERNGHAWFKGLEPDAYDLGSGKRVIAQRGRLHPKWAITVPREMHDENEHG